MRIPGRKIYRAFKELDGFSDEQCARFVRAANRGFWWGCLRVLVWGSCGLTVLAVVLIGVGFLTGRWEKWFDDNTVEFVGDLSPWLAAALMLPVVLLVIRDWLLIRRVRSILATRGRCGGCGYGLLGLPIDERLLVICPECGTQTKVDESLGELTLDAQGKARFHPNADALGARKKFWTLRRKKWGIRAGIAVILVFVVLPLGAIGVRELMMLAEAGEARADRQRFRREWEALLEDAQPAGTSINDPNAWTVFASIVEKHDAAFQSLVQDKDRNPTEAIPQPDLIYMNSAATVQTDDAVANQIQEDRLRDDIKARELGLVLIEQLRKEGVFSQMAEMAATRRALPDFEVDWERPLTEVLSPMLGKCRALVRMNAARMYLARQNGDVEEFVRAAEANFSLVRIARYGPNLIWQLVATAMQEATIEQCREYFAMGAPSELAGKLREAMRRQESEPQYEYGLQGDRLATDDTIAWLFSDPSRVRFGLRSQAVQTFVGNSSEIPIWKSSIRSYRANRDVTDACFRKVAANANLECWERSAVSVAATEYPLVEAFLFGFNAIMTARDRGLLSERSFELVLRIEVYRAKHGKVPETLQQLEGVNGGATIRDPQTGVAFGYIRLDEFDAKHFPEPEFDDASRKALERQGYLLFSAGSDRVLNFRQDGKVLVAFHEIAWNSIPSGADVLLTPLPRRKGK